MLYDRMVKVHVHDSFSTYDGWVVSNFQTSKGRELVVVENKNGETRIHKTDALTKAQ